MVRPPIEILVTKRGSYRRHDRSRSKSALGDQKLLVNTFFEFFIGRKLLVNTSFEFSVGRKLLVNTSFEFSVGRKLLVNTFFEFLVGHGSPFGVLLTAAKASIGAALAPSGEYTLRPGGDRPLIGRHSAVFGALGP